MIHELHHLYPRAPIYTAVLHREALPELTRSWEIRTTFLQGFPGVRHYSRALLPLMPRAFDRLDLRGYDVVITASSAFSKNVATAPGATNVCYCHTPPRYLWDLHDAYAGGVTGVLAAPLVAWLRARDREAAGRVGHFVANSRTVASRIARTYGRTATIVHPPVNLDRLVPSGAQPDDFYLVVARLVGYKRIDLAVKACTELGRKLIVVGDGPERDRLERMAGPSVTFAGVVSDDEVAGLYARCKAFLFPGLEDFGIAPLEAQAAGRPVVAFGMGGATETVVDQVTGLFFKEQTCAALVDAMLALERLPIDPLACRANAARFDAGVFRSRMAEVVAAAFRGALPPG